MKNIKFHIIRFACLVGMMLSLPITARGGSYREFYHTSTRSNTVNAIYCDQSGTIWLGTMRGLQRYDDLAIGDSTRDLYPDKLNQPIHYVTGTSDGCIWIVANSTEKFIYDPTTHRITVIDKEWLHKAGIEANGHWELTFTGRGNEEITFMKSGKIFVYNINAKKVSEIKDLSGVRYTYSDKNYLYALTNDNIYIYDGMKNIFIIPLPEKGNRGFTVMDSKGNVWHGFHNLYRFDSQSGSWDKLKTGLNVSGILECENGIYVATNSLGLLSFDLSGKLESSLCHNAYDSYSLTSNNIQFSNLDNRNNLWVSYGKGGVSVASPSGNESRVRHIQPIIHGNIKDDILSVAEDSDGILWMGTDGEGLFRTISETGTVTGKGLMEEAVGGNNAVTALFRDSKGGLWTGLYRNGLIYFNNGTIKRYFDGWSVYSIAEDDSGIIYAGMLGEGLYRIDRDKGTEPQKVNLGYGDFVQQIANGDMGSLLLARSDGLCSVNTRTLEVTHIKGNQAGSQKFCNMNMQSVMRDSRGLIWIIGSDGKNKVEIFDRQNDTIFTLPISENINFKSIVEDNNKTVWLASESEIYNVVVAYDSRNKKYLLKHYVFRNRNNENADHIYNYRSVAKLGNGNLLFGTTNGYLVINPSLYLRLGLEKTQDGLFSSLAVNNNIVAPGDTVGGRVILEKDIALTDRLVLDHDCNSLRITFSPRDYTSPFSSSYYYEVDGLDNAPKHLDNGVIELSNLSPGSYRLRVMEDSDDGSEDMPVASIDVEVKSPWYSTPWAFIAYFLIICVVVAITIFYFTDRQKQKMRVSQAEKEVMRQQQLNEMKLRFFTNISHDFRTPLSLIITPLEAYMNENNDKKDTTLLTPVYKNAVRLLNLVNQILDFRKLEITGMKPQMSYGDVVSFIRDICSSFTLFSEDSGIELKVETDISSLHTYFDKDKLSKIMMNLLSNAFKFTESGGTVTVAVASEGDNVKISVSDTGKGISDNDKPNIFKRFYQAGNENNREMGSGIGLHIVKELVELLGGKISVADNVPVGTVFSFSLPVVRSIDDNGSSTDPDDNLADIEEKEQTDNMPVILLVEDNKEFIDFTASILSEDYKILKAANGKEAMAILEHENVNVIVSDVMMDEMDGFELCKAVKTNINTSHVPVILLTARILAEDEMKGLEMGADDYVTKPFNITILKQKIKKLLDDNRRYHDKFNALPDISPSEMTITSLDEEFLSDAIKAVEENMSNPDFSVEMLSNILGMHRTHLYKKLSGITGRTPIEFIRMIRLKRGMQYLGKSRMYISEIAYKVGFNTPKLFTKYFKEEFKMSPREYIRSLDKEEQ